MQKNPPKIRAIIFDLDDTLYDCSGTLVLRGRRQAAGKIARLINCSEEEAYSLQLEMDEKFGVNTNIYEKIVTLYNLPSTYAQELLEEFVHIDISGITVFPDVMDTLIQLKGGICSYRYFRHYSLSRCNGYPDSVEGTGLQDGSGHLRG